MTEFLAIMLRKNGRGTYGGNAQQVAVFVSEALHGKFGAFSLLTVEPIDVDPEATSGVGGGG